jgi:hypothetical protein
VPNLVQSHEGRKEEFKEFKELQEFRRNSAKPLRPEIAAKRPRPHRYAKRCEAGRIKHKIRTQINPVNFGG